MEGFANLQFHFLSWLDALFFAFANNNFILDGIGLIRKIRKWYQISVIQRSAPIVLHLSAFSFSERMLFLTHVNLEEAITKVTEIEEGKINRKKKKE